MKKMVIAAACAATFLALPVTAQLYVGAGVGAAKTDSHETSGKIYVGYQLTPIWGTELGYNDLNRYRGSDIESWTLAGTGARPLGLNWSLLGKLGVASNRPHFAGAENKTDLLVGIGMGYAMSRNIGMRLEYENFGKLSDNDGVNNSRGRNLGLSAKYLF